MLVRERGRAAALVLGVLAVLGALAALVVAPGSAVGTQSRSVATAGSSAGPARPAVPPAASRTRGLHQRSALRPVRALATPSLRSPAATGATPAVRGQLFGAGSRATSNLRHSLPGGGPATAGLVLAALVLTGLAGARRGCRAVRRTSMVLRGRAPPAPAFA